MSVLKYHSTMSRVWYCMSILCYGNGTLSQQYVNGLACQQSGMTVVCYFGSTLCTGVLISP